MGSFRHILITGPPGCGKTTLLRRLADCHATERPAGFFTEEIREKGARRGFRMVSLEGQEGILAHVTIAGRYRVGRYGVDVEGFEDFLKDLNLLSSDASLIFIDEIGRMECLSEAFIDLMRRLFESKKTVVATIAAKGGGFIAEVRNREDCDLFSISPSNRDALWGEIEEKVGRLLK